MTIKFGESMKNYEDKKKAFADSIKNNAPEEEQEKAHEEMMNAMVNDLAADVKKSVANVNYDSSVLIARGENQITSEERKFYNELTTDVGYKEEKLIPETIITRVFDDLEKDHPFLSTIKITTTGVRTRIIEADTSGQVVWGNLFGEIRGQLDAIFTEKDLKLGKATCFVVVPKDLKDTGVTWIDAFVRAQIREAYAVAFEKVAILGGGASVSEPIGLMKDKQPNGGVVDKEVSGTLTFEHGDVAIKEFRDFLAKLSVFEKNDITRYRKVRGLVSIAVNPVNALFAETAFMKVTENNVYVTATPFGVTIVENEFVPADKAVVYIRDNYEIGVGGDKIVRMYDQTLAIEDCDLYTAKQFAYGEPKDNTSSLVYDLAIDGMPTVEELPEA